MQRLRDDLRLSTLGTCLILFNGCLSLTHPTNTGLLFIFCRRTGLPMLRYRYGYLVIARFKVNVMAWVTRPRVTTINRNLKLEHGTFSIRETQFTVRDNLFTGSRSIPIQNSKCRAKLCPSEDNWSFIQFLP